MLTTDERTSPVPGDTIPGLDARIGPWLVATLLHSIETGIIIGQAITFLSYTSARAPGRTRGVRERRLVKTVALFVLLIAVLQTSSSVWNSWDTLVRNFGNAYEAIQVSWVMKSQQMINVLLAVPVQAFLIWRCWLTMNRNPYILSGLIMLVLASLAMSTYVTFRIFKGMSEIVSEVSSEFLIVNPYDPFYILSLILPTMLDVLLTGILFTYFFRSRNIVISRHFRKILSSLMVVIWEAALPPCVCSIITTIMYFDKRQSSFWNLMFQEVLGQLYVISFFVTVNGFLGVKHSDTRNSHATPLSPSWGFSGVEVTECGWKRERELERGVQGGPSMDPSVAVDAQTAHGPDHAVPGLAFARSRSPRSPRRSRNSHYRVEMPVSVLAPGWVGIGTDTEGADTKGLGEGSCDEDSREPK